MHVNDRLNILYFGTERVYIKFISSFGSDRSPIPLKKGKARFSMALVFSVFLELYQNYFPPKFKPILIFFSLHLSSTYTALIALDLSRPRHRAAIIGSLHYSSYILCTQTTQLRCALPLNVQENSQGIVITHKIYDAAIFGQSCT
jgi:hypothetical protein